MIIMMDHGLKLGRGSHQEDFKTAIMQVYFHVRDSVLWSDHLGSNLVSAVYE